MIFGPFARARHRRGAAVLVCVAIASGACSHQPPAAELGDQVKPIGSWLATLQMTSEAWSANSVPAHFARDTVEAAKAAMVKAASAAERSDAPPEVREPLRRLLADALRAARELAGALAHEDRRAAPLFAARFHALAARFDTWERQASGGQR